jgi:RND family efflux transporter MFP subunit
MKIAQKALDNTELRAYFSGTISVRYVENFKNIQAKEPIVSMEDRSILEIVVNVPEKIIATFHEEDIVSLKASFETILNEKFPLVVKEISTKADNATRTYAVVLVMQPPSKYNILSGMTADVEVILAKNTQIDKILIPSTAVLGDKENKSFVWIYAKNSSSVLKREVSIGEMSGVAIEIQSGLQAGEIIVSAGVNYLFDGMVVRPLAGKLGE